MKPEKQVFEYALIRLVPRVERGECLNVGVILFCKRKQYLGIRLHLDEARVQVFAPSLDLAEVQAYLTSWETVALGKADGGPIAQYESAERFRWLTAARSTIVQASAVHPGLCTDPEQVIEKLFQEYVL